MRPGVRVNVRTAKRTTPTLEPWVALARCEILEQPGRKISDVHGRPRPPAPFDELVRGRVHADGDDSSEPHVPEKRQRLNRTICTVQWPKGVLRLPDVGDNRSDSPANLL